MESSRSPRKENQHQKKKKFWICNFTRGNIKVWEVLRVPFDIQQTSELGKTKWLNSSCKCCKRSPRSTTADPCTRVFHLTRRSVHWWSVPNPMASFRTTQANKLITQLWPASISNTVRYTLKEPEWEIRPHVFLLPYFCLQSLGGRC